MTKPKKITVTRYQCGQCMTLHDTERNAGKCCSPDCAHIWDLQRDVKDWGDGMFTVYVECRHCDATSYIEGHADENSDAIPTPKWSVKE